MYSIAILALNNCLYSSVIGPSEIFAVTNRICRDDSLQTGKRFSGEPLFTAGIVLADQEPATSFDGMVINSEYSTDCGGKYDIIIVPAFYGDFETVLGHEKLKRWIGDQHQQGAHICTVCAGSFLAAELGLLHGRRATTHWALAEKFRRRYPEVRLQVEKMLIDEGDVISAGGMTAYLDLSLYLVNRFGSSDLASRLSQTLLIDGTRQDQLPYFSFAFLKNHGDQEIVRVQEWLDDNFANPVTVSQLADIAGLGERTFTRRFKKATGEAPSVYLQAMRIEAARRLLRTTSETFEIITTRVGYDDSSSFRKLFRKTTGLSPSVYRKKFNVTPFSG